MDRMQDCSDQLACACRRGKVNSARASILFAAAVALLVAIPVFPALAEEELVARPTIDELLDTQGFAIEAEPVRQIFVPYLKVHGQRVFVTSDSILSAYAILLEESFARLEWVRAQQMPDAVHDLVNGLDGGGLDLQLDSGLVGRARLRALRVVAVALGLLGEEYPADLDDASRALVQTEVERIERAEGQHSCEWLGPVEAGFLAIDYDRFRPRGLYAEHDPLRRYFRATAWLQAVPFRIAIDEEHVAAILLAQGLRGSATSHFFLGYDKLLAPGDDLSVPRLGWDGYSAVTPEALARHKDSVAKRATNRPLVNDQVAVAPIRLNARILSAARLPDAVLFQYTAAPAPEAQADRLPTALEVVAALGSPVAEAALGPMVRERIERAPPLVGYKPKYRGDRPGYERLLLALESLLAEPEPDAPVLFGSDAWRWKSCQTVLAGWALVRHTFVLQAKPSANYGGVGGKPAGFVEPVPTFYARLREAAEFTSARLKARGAFDVDPARYQLAGRLRACAARARKGAPPQLRDFDYWGGRDGWDTIKLAWPRLQAKGIPHVSDGETYGARIAAALEGLASDLEVGTTALDDRVRRQLGASRKDLGTLWEKLIRVCLQLEILAHKQLREVDFSEAENRFLLHYGGALGKLHLYGGNAYLSPRDDAPRIADVVSDPFRGVVVHAAIGRPHRIHVRYPWKGEDLLCVGGVMAYYEPHAAKRLTDADWRALLDGGGMPRPAWAEGLFAAPKPKEEGDD